MQIDMSLMQVADELCRFLFLKLGDRLNNNTYKFHFLETYLRGIFFEKGDDNMSIKIQRLINLAMVLLSWLTFPFLGLNNIKRFFPATLLIVFFEFLNVLYGKKRKWWVFYNKPKSYILNEFSFNLGPFLVGSLWIMKWTYGNFKQFLLLNATINALFAFIIIKFLDKLRVAKLNRLSNFQFFMFFFYKAPLLYGIQYMIENKKKFSQLKYFFTK